MSSKKKTHRKKDYAIYESKDKSPAFELFILQKRIEYIRNRIQNAYKWIPRLAIENPEVDSEKVFSELRERQSALEKEESECLKVVKKDELLFQKPFTKKGSILQKHGNTLGNILLQTATSRKSAQKDSSCDDYYTYGSVKATEFKEYKSTLHSGVNAESEWYFRRGTSQCSIIDAERLCFDASAFPVPGEIGNHIMTAGLLKFNFPVAPCNTVIEWNAQVNIDFILGATIWGEDDWIMVDLIIREQPDSTSFPDVGLDDPGFEWIEWGDLDFTYPDAPNHRRRTKREHVSGQFQVDHGITSSLIIGPSLFVNSFSEWASIGRMDNLWDDGSFFFHGFGDDCYYGVPCGPEDLCIEYLMRPL